MRASDKFTCNRHSRRGIALTLVIILMAVAVVMAYAMLANAVVQQQVAANETAGAQADALAESGVELAMYYLQHPQNAPSLVAVSGRIPPYWAGGSSLSFANLSGHATVTVAPSGTTGTLFSVTSKGTYTGASGLSLSKTVSAIAQVNYTFLINQGVMSSTSLGLSQYSTSQVMTINQTAGATVSAINAFGAVTLGKKAATLGLIAASSVSGIGTWSHTLAAAPSYGLTPPISQVRSYSSYTYNGQAGFSGLLGATLTALNMAAQLIGVGGLNSLNVLSNTSGSTSITGPVTLSGIVYVPNGNVTITGNVTINSPATGFPALVVGQQIIMAASATLTVNGIVYAGTGIGSGGNSSSAITVNGALLLGSPSISSTYQGSLAVNYNSSQASAPDFTSDPIYMTPKSVKLTSWSP
jgi:Tfp pilus assembly protein PilX